MLEKSRVPSSIGIEMAEKIMDIGTMKRFFKLMELEKFEFKPSSFDAKKKRRTKEERRKQQLQPGAMELETIPEGPKEGGRIVIEEIQFH